MMDKVSKLFHRGDTLVEVMFAVGIFGVVAIGAISIMNRGLYDAQNALEISMARNEIDAQAESLRFIHNAYISERNTKSKLYTKIWNTLKYRIYQPSALPADFYTKYNNYSCDDIYGGDAFPNKSFVINSRRLNESIVKDYLQESANGSYTSPGQTSGDAMIVYNATYINDNAHLLAQSPVYPRMLYSATYGRNRVQDIAQSLSDQDVNDTNTYYDTLTKAQGIWVTGVASDDNSNPEYYDFYIRTCWYSPGSSNPNTISTIIRLFNPDFIPPIN